MNGPCECRFCGWWIEWEEERQVWVALAGQSTVCYGGREHLPGVAWLPDFGDVDAIDEWLRLPTE